MRKKEKFFGSNYCPNCGYEIHGHLHIGWKKIGWTDKEPQICIFAITCPKCKWDYTIIQSNKAANDDVSTFINNWMFPNDLVSAGCKNIGD